MSDWKWTYEESYWLDELNDVIVNHLLGMTIQEGAEWYAMIQAAAAAKFPDTHDNDDFFYYQRDKWLHKQLCGTPDVSNWEELVGC